jgi:hypothetical protein
MGGYATQIEPDHLVLERQTIRLPRLAPTLDGFRIALMADHHLFPFTPRKVLEQAVERANALHPDLILLGGDYVCADVESIRDLTPMLGRLNAKYGVFAILGNYDCLRQPDLIHAQLAGQSIEVLVNRGLPRDREPDDSSWPGWIRFGRGAPDPIQAFAGYREATSRSRLCMNPIISQLRFGSPRSSCSFLATAMAGKFGFRRSARWSCRLGPGSTTRASTN